MESSKRKAKLELSSLSQKAIDKILQMLGDLSDQQCDELLQNLLQEKQNRSTLMLEDFVQMLEKWPDEQRNAILRLVSKKRGLVPISDTSSIHMRLQIYDYRDPYVITAPINVLVEDLLTQLVADLDLPRVTSNGYSLAYSFIIRKKSGEQFFLQCGKTLSAAGIEPGCEILLLPTLPINLVEESN